MKKILAIILVLACSLALFACEDETADTITEINNMYNAFAPSMIVTETTQTFGNYTLTSSSTLKTGKVDGFDASVYEYSYQRLRSVEDGATAEIVGVIETVTGKWEYHAEKGYRENGGKWDDGYDFAPEAGAIALKITADTVQDLKNDSENKTITFTVLAANTEAVLGNKIDADVAVTLTHSGADITGVTLTYTVSNADNADYPEISVVIKAQYSYDSQQITITG